MNYHHIIFISNHSLLNSPDHIFGMCACSAAS